MPDGPSSVRLWREKCAFEEICLATAVLLLQISQFQHKIMLFICYCLLSVCILDKEWLYVCLTNITFINRMYVLFLVQFANCVGNDQLVAEIHHQICRSHCENGRYNYNLKAYLTSLFLNDSSVF